jgi:hypothetical protein
MKTETQANYVTEQSVGVKKGRRPADTGSSTPYRPLKGGPRIP